MPVCRPGNSGVRRVGPQAASPGRPATGESDNHLPEMVLSPTRKPSQNALRDGKAVGERSSEGLEFRGNPPTV